ncbi:hypothetical protein [Klenkia brasiliensis]|uniref:Uncharacterized protein n=1 Tax=Klenkia brasiliensis TaxID=333142 RepID=A0A1G7PHZ5_9ACTN|nr:hypothetical protein [Klenkia brasiliensis]SDF86002.1 hypothetical protein SAMN05660324_1102 [Klenkia brasiliensis]
MGDSRRGWVVSTVVLACTTAVLALTSVALWVGTYDGRRDVELATVAEAFADRIGPSADATEAVCREPVLCTQALRSDGALLMAFDRQDEASAAAAALGGDSRLAGYVVLRFEDGRLSQEERAGLAATLYCLHIGPDPC